MQSTTWNSMPNNSKNSVTSLDPMSMSPPQLAKGSEFIPSAQTLSETMLQQGHMENLNRAASFNNTFAGTNEINHEVIEPIKQKRCSKTRYEAFVWESISKGKGRSGGYATQDEAARAHNLVAIKIWGTCARTNFPVTCYVNEINEMKHLSREEWILAVQQKSEPNSSKSANNEEEMTNASNIVVYDAEKMDSEAYVAPYATQHGVNTISNSSIVGGFNGIDSGAMFPNMEQAMFQGTSLQAPQATLLETGNMFYENNNLFNNQSLFQSPPPFLQSVDLSFPHWPSNFGNLVEGTLGNSLISRPYHMGNENPAGGIGSGTVGFQSYEPSMYGLDQAPLLNFPNDFQNNGFQGDPMIGSSNNFDMSQFPNSSNNYMEENMDSILAQMNSGNDMFPSSNLGFGGNGML
ncbi:DNA-binding domain superfamily [Sesbania bispinosa]|nr:DNA-binding domain superfamily [Sesbania bispinosa]